MNIYSHAFVHRFGYSVCNQFLMIKKKLKVGRPYCACQQQMIVRYRFSLVKEERCADPVNPFQPRGFPLMSKIVWC